MWIIQADTHTRAVGYRAELWLVYVLYIVYVKHTRTRNVLRILKVLFASCSLQSISRERCEWGRAGEREREQLNNTDSNNNTDNAHSLLLCPLAFFLCLRLRKTRIIYINNNPDYERFTQCDRMRPKCKIPQVLLQKIPMHFASLPSMLSAIDHKR